MTFKVLYGPIVEELGYDYSPSDTSDARERRMTAVAQAAFAGHTQYVIRGLYEATLFLTFI